MVNMATVEHQVITLRGCMFPLITIEVVEEGARHGRGALPVIIEAGGEGALARDVPVLVDPSPYKNGRSN